MCTGLGIISRVAATVSHLGFKFSGWSQKLPTGLKWRPLGQVSADEIPPSQKKNFSHADSSFTNPSVSHDGPGLPPPLLLPPYKN